MGLFFRINSHKHTVLTSITLLKRRIHLICTFLALLPYFYLKMITRAHTRSGTWPECAEHISLSEVHCGWQKGACWATDKARLCFISLHILGHVSRGIPQLAPSYRAEKHRVDGNHMDPVIPGRFRRECFSHLTEPTFTCAISFPDSTDSKSK